MTKLLSTLLYRIWLVSATLIVLFAILISIGRALVPYANNYKHHLEDSLSELMGSEVSIGAITTEWKSLGPSLSLQNIIVKDTISIGSLSSDIKTIPSIFYRTLITDNLTINEVELYVEQLQDGSIVIAGQEQPNTNQATATAAFDYALLQDWLQSQTEITITEANIQLNLRNQASYPINISEMIFRRGVNIYQLQGFTQLPGENRIDFVLEADGLLTDPATTGQLFLDTHELNLSKIPLSAFWQEARIEDGSFRFKAWVDWQNRRFSKAFATLDINDFQMTLQDAPQGNLNSLSTQLLWQQYSDGWQLETNAAVVRSNQRDWPEPFVQLRMRQGEGYKQEYYLRSSRLDVGIWVDLLLAKQDLDTDLRQRLLAMDPQGFLNAVQIDAIIETGQLLDLNLSARFSELSFNPVDTAPGIKNMAGQIQLFEDSGNLYLDSRYAEYNEPQMFRSPLSLDYINANLDWVITEDNVTIEIQHFSSDIHNANLKTDGRIIIPRNDDPVQMDIYAELTGGDMSETSKFLPYGIMSENLVSYLDEAILSGSLSDVRLLLRGDSNNFPYQNNTGVFAIYGNVSDASYKFEPSWPELNKMNADLWFVGNSMDISVTSAESYQHQINKASVVIEDFDLKPTTLLISSNSQGQLDSASDYIRHSPLNEDVSPVIDILDMAGLFELDLDLTIPIKGDGKRISGEIRVNDATTTVSAINLTASNVTGSLQIENGSVTSRDLSASILGGKSNIVMKQSNTTQGLDTELSLIGEITLPAVYDTFADLIPNGLEGKTDYQATVTIPPNSDSFDVTIDTRTLGMTSTIPHPLSKTADIGLPLKLQYQQLSSSESQFRLDWLDKFSFISAYENAEMTAAIMALGTNEVTLPDRNGIAITGVADTLDLVAWLNYLTDIESANNEGEPSDYDKFYLDNLSISTLNYFFLDFTNTQVSGEFGKEKLKFLLAGDDLQGEVTVPLPFGQKAIDINLARLQIDDQFIKVDEQTESVEKKPDAEPLPAINLRCEKCLYTDINLGKTNVNLVPLANGNQVSITVATDNILSMDITSQWYSESAEVFTKVQGWAKTNNLGRLMNILHQDAGIRDTPMRLNGEIAWQGDPSMFNVETMLGNLLVKGGKGSQKELSDKKARIFSLFSLGSIARKLTLDFSDLFQDGFFFTSMEGSFEFNQGIMKTENVLVKGTSADVQVKGNIDFTKNKIEQCILVTPDLSSSLPILAGWAIEPVTGIFVFLMSKIFQPAIDVVSSIRYQVEGNLDDPTITEIGKSTARARISEDDKNPSITVEESEKPFSCNDQFK